MYDNCCKQLLGNYHEDIENYDKMSIILIYLFSQRELKVKYTKHDEVLTPLSLLLTNNIKEASKKKEIMERDYDFQFNEGLKEEIKDMRNLSDGIELMAIERTTKKVTAEVTKKITKNVTKKNNLLHVKNLMESGLTEIQAMDILKLTPTERMNLLQEFN